MSAISNYLKPIFCGLPTFSKLATAPNRLQPLFDSAKRGYSSSALAIEKRTVIPLHCINRIADSFFPTHPFSNGLTTLNAKAVLQRYLAMSEAFPLLEESCHTHFHANLLKNDLKTIFHLGLQPDYCPATKAYLMELEKRLFSENKVERCAMMVAFKTHSHRMIESLWESISDIYGIDKEKLIYFQTHVDQNCPSGAHQVAMVQKWIQNLDNKEEQEHFIRRFVECYRINDDWCQAICK